MCGKNHVRTIYSFILVVFIVTGLCGLALAAPSSTTPVRGSTPVSQPATANPTSGVKAAQPPTISSITPTTSLPGHAVVIMGINFGATRGTSYVSFGTFKSKTYTRWSDTEIHCIVPSITSNTFPIIVPVTVTTANGTSEEVSLKLLGQKPIVLYISPPTYPDGTTASLTITGANFRPGARVEFWSLPATGKFQRQLPDLTDVVVVSSTKITGKEILENVNLGLFCAEVTNTDGVPGSGGLFLVYQNPCGTGAATGVVGVGLMLGVMTLAGAVRTRRRRKKA